MASGVVERGHQTTGKSTSITIEEANTKVSPATKYTRAAVQDMDGRPALGLPNATSRVLAHPSCVLMNFQTLRISALPHAGT